MLVQVQSLLDEARANDLSCWASRYNLYVQWSPDKSHQWDSMDNSLGSGKVGIILDTCSPVAP